MAFGIRSGVETRAAVPADAADLARLLHPLDNTLTTRDVAERLEALARHPEGAVLVAADYGPVVGVIALRWSAVLQQARPAAWITTLVVDDRERRRGIGRMLIKVGAQAARAAGCDTLDVVALPEEDGQLFLRALGFTPAGQGFSRSLRKRAAGG
ncbi:GNAT family N-acetyltransferase [Roseomonas sp. BN140053]|uniref:GNAT family N-acetyltransferase n=1 Tax=Roseomonas sp. BN140053 TaxID=3391898 RepID=UPI0039EA89F3